MEVRCAMNNHFMVKSVCQARELNSGPSAFRAAALPLSYEAGMNLQGTTFEHALLLCKLLVTLTAAGFAFKTGIFSHVPLRVGSPAPAGDCHVYVGRCLVCS